MQYNATAFNETGLLFPLADTPLFCVDMHPTLITIYLIIQHSWHGTYGGWGGWKENKVNVMWPPVTNQSATRGVNESNMNEQSKCYWARIQLRFN